MHRHRGRDDLLVGGLAPNLSAAQRLDLSCAPASTMLARLIDVHYRGEETLLDEYTFNHPQTLLGPGGLVVGDAIMGRLGWYDVGYAGDQSR